jgi:dTDP-4-dehydrorhamnose reductase
MKIALLGPDGQVGWELRRALSPLGELIPLTRAEGGDLSRPEALAAALRTLRPDAVVNAAAYTAVDKAESEPALAHTVNAEAPAAVAAVVCELGGWLLHYSTDYVFDGSGSQPWRETDTPAPLSVYGRTKLEGEQQIAQSGCRHLIFRTSWVYAARGGNFARTMLRLAQERDTLSVIDDQIGAPTGADLLADVSAHVLRHIMPPVGHNALAQPGVYHLAAGGETSWHGYARFVLETAAAAGLSLKVGPDHLTAIASAAYPTPARRPHNSRLDTGKLQVAFGLSLPDWQQGVARMLAEIL